MSDNSFVWNNQPCSAPQQPHSYYGAPASTGYGQQSYQPQAAYHPAPHVHQYAAPSQQSHPRKSHHVQAKSTASAMSALTLLAFMFFLNILQSCLKEHMMTMNPTVSPKLNWCVRL